MDDVRGHSYAHGVGEHLEREVPSRSAEPSAPGPTTVVVVTDDDAFARELCDRLDLADDVNVLGVMAHMSTAITFSGRRDPRIVVVDLRMRGILEEDLVRGLRRAVPTSVIVAAKGSGSVEEESDIRSAGADVYLEGRVPIDELVARLTG